MFKLGKNFPLSTLKVCSLGSNPRTGTAMLDKAFTSRGNQKLERHANFGLSQGFG